MRIDRHRRRVVGRRQQRQPRSGLRRQPREKREVEAMRVVERVGQREARLGAELHRGIAV